MCHNGEINTLKGNISRMKAREELLSSPLISKEDINKVLPIILPGKSDSASMDMVVELLLISGRSLPEIMMMLVPEAWEKHNSMSDVKKAFYKYNSNIMEPWDGPASIPFTDGDYIGAVLDRNGLRPSRYTVTKDGYVIMSSETGVVEIESKNVLSHGRLEPGKIFLVDESDNAIAYSQNSGNLEWFNKDFYLRDLTSPSKIKSLIVFGDFQGYPYPITVLSFKKIYDPKEPILGAPGSDQKKEEDIDFFPESKDDLWDVKYCHY